MAGTRTFISLAFAALVLTPGQGFADAVSDANGAVNAAKAGHYDDAIKLFSSAIYSDELTLEGRAQAFAYRGIAKAAIADYDGARMDLDFSVALDSPYNSDAYAYRGYFELVEGDAQKAATDLTKSARLHIWPYNALWLRLAREKANLPDADDVSLANNAGRLKLMQWPGPVVNFLLGKATRDQAQEAANDGDPQKLAERVCDADFYVAEYDLAHGNAALAKPGLQRAADKCPFASFERMGATAELMRLK